MDNNLSISRATNYVISKDFTGVNEVRVVIKCVQRSAQVPTDIMLVTKLSMKVIIVTIQLVLLSILNTRIESA